MNAEMMCFIMHVEICVSRIGNELLLPFEKQIAVSEELVIVRISVFLSQFRYGRQL